jgi:ATP-dependent helicase/nuclease subunit A
MFDLPAKTGQPGRTPQDQTAPDQAQRDRAVDPKRSILVQAPAGSGKTTLLTERFLTLLAEVEEPGQIVAITFTNAAAAEMRNRILQELRNPDPSPLARRVLERPEAQEWKLGDLPAQLRVLTIDGFCRELALQQPLLSGLGGGLEIAENPEELYRKAARRTIQEIENGHGDTTGSAVETLLKWRDNKWQELEDLLTKMLAGRDRWMYGFVLNDRVDWDQLRRRLERPFADAVHAALKHVSQRLDQVPTARQEAIELSRFACTQDNGDQHRGLAELVAFPLPPFATAEALEEAQHAFQCLANLVLIKGGTFRSSITKAHGFPTDRKAEKSRLTDMIQALRDVPDLERDLAAVRDLPPVHYSEDEWLILRSCFSLLRRAVGHLKVVFAETGAADFTEVSQIAQSVLSGEDGVASDVAQAVAGGIRHLLVDEFQDTSRRQHQLLAHLIAAWPDRAVCTLFAVGDPMQSIYFFRDAEAELFARVKEIGLEIPEGEPVRLDFVPLTANFRTEPLLVERLNQAFAAIFHEDDGSGISFTAAAPARTRVIEPSQVFTLNLNFTVQVARGTSEGADIELAGIDSLALETAEIVELIRARQPAVEAARAAGGKYRVAVLGRTKAALTPIAEGLRAAGVPFRAVDLECLADRTEVLDAVALARAALNPYDRVAWLGVLRAPWCGLSLADLHLAAGGDDAAVQARPVPQVLSERLGRLSEAGQIGVRRVIAALAATPAWRGNGAGPEDEAFAGRVKTSAASLGTWLEQIWRALGGEDCYDAQARSNLALLWSCLDRLPEGQLDIVGPALDVALRKLTALPDPQSSSELGVQLMTIHKSKGLEFEVVIVPELQKGVTRNTPKLLSWLERGVVPDRESRFELIGESDFDAITEFLIAPIPLKGGDAGQSKKWVDRVYREREMQEMRRILYVAATRAREELHLFARPACKVDKKGALSLVEPKDSLLATAWPAFGVEIEAKFEAWKSELARSKDVAVEPPSGEELVVTSLAASADGALFLVPDPAATPLKPALLRRLPDNYLAGTSAAERQRPEPRRTDPGTPSLFTRHEGGLVSRATGIAVHSMLEELTRLRLRMEWPEAREALRGSAARIAARVRSGGVAAQQAATMAADALQVSLHVSQDALGEWILSPHAHAQSEARWTGVIGGAMRTVQADRVFQAGLTPLSETPATARDQAWWIVDYKTVADLPTNDQPAELARLREIFRPQLDAYAQMLRNLHGDATVIRAGLYYPRLLRFDWWGD